MDKNIKIYHKDWIDNLLLDFEKNIIKRIYYNNDNGKFILIDNLLLINWIKWGNEYFYSDNNYDYYQICDNNNFKLDYKISIIYLIDELYSNKYILDNTLQKIYNANNLKLYGNFTINNNNLTVKYENENITYIYFNNKYYNKKFIDKKYEIVYIHDKKYFLDRESNICYENNNIFKKDYYIKYKNKLKLSSSKNIYEIEINKNISLYTYLLSKVYEQIDENYILYVKTEEDVNTTQKNFMKPSENTYKDYIIIINIDDIFNIIEFIEYYIYFDVKYIIFDDIINTDKNNIFDNLNIIYYNKIDEVYNIYDNFTKIYINNDISKLSHDELLNICDIDIMDLWYKLNKNNLEKYDYILNFSKNTNEIPKIMHFIWLGNNILPEKYIYYIESWIKNHEDWIFCFWNDDNIPVLINQKYYDETDVYAMKADILRYELLYIFGGVYVDCDFLCIKNIDNIIKNYIGFSGYESDEYIAIGLMGFIQNDIILYNIIKNLSHSINKNKYKNINENIPKLTGPIYFTKIWNLYKTDLHYSFPIEYFYSYSFQDKFLKKGYTLNINNYAIHMWGHSWDNKKIFNKNDKNEYYLMYFYLSQIIIDINNDIIKKMSYIDISNYLKNKIFFKSNNKTYIKKKIVHIMGLFFTGGIERYLYYIDKYGNHDIYNYYLLYISNGNYVYNISNMNMISFDWNNNHLNKLLILIKPDLIIDHYSIYINQNIYQNINNNIIIYFIHSAICYNNDIHYLSGNKCINLYDENKKHSSWNNILNNYYLTLGTELNDLNEKIIKNCKIKISIIGRIAEEKLGIDFFKKLCVLSFEIYDTIEIHIYGEKNRIFNNEYTDIFEEYLDKSKIIYHSFINPLKMNDVYLDTDVLVIPSSYETGSFTCIEAFSYGIPVIARNVYGLKYMIKNGITGYLCEDDDDILEKITNIHSDQIINNTNIIKKESLKYNIIDKIKDLEYIINKNINNKNIVIITSVINCVNKPLSYYHKRSIFDVHERYKHTLKSIESIKKYIKNVEILLCECSDFIDNYEIEEDIKNNVDYYYNFYDNEDIKKNVESELKGLGEASLLLEGINKLKNIQKTYKNIFKLSGRYFLNSNFNYEIFNNNCNVFTNWDNSKCSYCTIFYKINANYIDYYKNILVNSIEDLKNKNSIEICMYKYFIENINVVEKVHVSGYLATEGYLFSV